MDPLLKQVEQLAASAAEIEHSLELAAEGGLTPAERKELRARVASLAVQYEALRAHSGSEDAASMQRLVGLKIDKLKALLARLE